jgi:hypothetical protein
MASDYNRLTRAMNILDGPGDIREKLASAYKTEVQYIGPDGLDEDRLNALETINDELTKIEASGDKDAVDMSVENLSDDEAQQLYSLIRDIYQYLAIHH